MNKQEVIDEIENAIPDFILNDYQRGEEAGLTYALELAKELDEPVKPVIPQYVADWYEENKDDFENSLAILIRDYFKGEIEDDNLLFWFGYDLNKDQPIKTLVNMHQFGYEVEKEKLYTVKFANKDFGEIYIGIFKKFNKLGISSLPLNNDEVKSWFTEDEIKKFKFWNNPAFEVKEVKE